MSEVRLVKLLTGEDILCKVNPVKNDNKLQLIQAKRIVLTPQGAALVNVCPFSEQEDFEINNEHVLYDVPVVDEIAKEYQNHVGDIITVESTLVTP